MGRPIRWTEEGAFVAKAHRELKKKEKWLTQTELAKEMGVSQGMLNQWWTGRTRIKDYYLLKLSTRLGFDPLEVRPELKESYKIAKEALDGGEYKTRLEASIDDLTEAESDLVLKYIRFLSQDREKI